MKRSERHIFLRETKKMTSVLTGPAVAGPEVRTSSERSRAKIWFGDFLISRGRRKKISTHDRLLLMR
ncbi:hypothetical protein BTE56_03365 [Agrobacterium pusense]|nr:hypothetical protein AYO27_23565 [Rhizobium sp. GHKF11]OOO23138.1 hypothetical protein BTE56_03365 [Agrobacterium pusense]PTV71489.1 hypothetical protein DBL06_22545 [Agrobacterium pusense]